jgi:hypothetical protein
MMTKEQQITVSQVYRQFAESDSKDMEWTNIDTYMEAMSWLDDNQLIIEAAVVHQIHCSGQPRCTQEHPIEHCFVPVIIDAIGHILDLYAETKNLHVKNRFVLEYYLAVTQEGLILS